MAYLRLPFSVEPIITTYLSHAQFLGILAGNMPNQEQWMPWIYNKYINCYFSQSPEFKFDVFAEDKLFVKDGVLEAVGFTIDTKSFVDILGYTEKDFIDMVRNVLLGGAYVWGIHNEKYIKCKKSYQKKDYLHGYMLHGFDDDKQAFLCATYGYDYNDKFVHNKYAEFWISYSEFYNSVFQLTYPKLSFRGMRLNGDFQFQINLSEIFNSISDYLSSTSRAKNEQKEGKIIFGITAWERLISYLKTVDKIDIRFVKIFKEHHDLMCLRLEYLCQNGIIDKHFFEDYKIVTQLSETAYYLALKYNQKQSLHIRNQCASYASKIVAIDYSVLNGVIDNWRHYL